MPDDTFALREGTCEVLGTYADGKGIALGLTRDADHTTVYMAVPDNTGHVWRALMEQAGVHTFIDAADRVYFDGRFLAFHFIYPEGERTVSLEEESEVWDVFARRRVSEGGKALTTHGIPGETVLYYLGDLEDLGL